MAKVKDNAVVNFEDFWSEWVRLSIKSYYCPNKIKGGQKTYDKVDLIQPNFITKKPFFGMFLKLCFFFGR